MVDDLELRELTEFQTKQLWDEIKIDISKEIDVITNRDNHNSLLANLSLCLNCSLLIPFQKLGDTIPKENKYSKEAVANILLHELLGLTDASVGVNTTVKEYKEKASTFTGILFRYMYIP